MLKESCLVEQTMNRSEIEIQLRNIVSNTSKKQTYAKQKLEQKNQSFVQDMKGKLNRQHDRLLQLEKNFRHTSKSVRFSPDRERNEFERESMGVIGGEEFSIGNAD